MEQPRRTALIEDPSSALSRANRREATAKLRSRRSGALSRTTQLSNQARKIRGTGGGQAVAPAATGVFVFVRSGFTPLGVPLRLGTRGAVVDWRSSPQLTAAPTGIRPPQIEQRARIETLVILAGSSRKTDRHSGQDTFIGSAGLSVSGSRAVVGPA